MTYRAAKLQGQIDQFIKDEDVERQANNRRRFGAGRGCPVCGDVPDGMRSIDAGYLADVLSIHTLGQLRAYLRRTAGSTKWYRRRGDSAIILYYGCWQCGPDVPPAEYRPLRISEKGDQPDITT